MSNLSDNSNKGTVVIPYQLIIVPVLLVAMLPMPYGYYTLVRLICCAMFVDLTVRLLANTDNPKLDGWRFLWFLTAFCAILYNPFIPVHLTKEIWTVTNLVSLGIGGGAVYLLSRLSKPKKKTGKAKEQYVTGKLKKADGNSMAKQKSELVKKGVVKAQPDVENSEKQSKIKQWVARANPGSRSDYGQYRKDGARAKRRSSPRPLYETKAVGQIENEVPGVSRHKKIVSRSKEEKIMLSIMNAPGRDSHHDDPYR